MAQEIKKVNGVYMGSQEIASTRFAGDANKVAYYKFDTGALTVDSSGNGYTLTNNNTVVDATGKFGGAASQGTSNTNKYLSTTNTMGIDGGTFSLSGWFKMNTEVPSDLYVLFSQANNTSHVYYAIFYEYNGGTRRLKFVRTKQGVAEQSFTYNITLGTTDFYHLALTYDGTNLCGYVNGNLVGQVAASGSGSGAITSGFYLGAFWDGTSSPSSQTSDDVYIASRALTSDEIYSLYKTGVKKLNGQVNLNPELESTSLRGDANLQMYQRFEGNSTDETANNNDGTDTGINYGTSYGKMGQGASFTNDDTSTAASSCISIANSATLSPGTGNFSISLWYKTSDARTNALHPLVIKYSSTDNDCVYYIAEAATTGYITAFFRDGDGDGVTMAATKSYKDGIWHHIVSVRDGTSGYLYIDGGLISSATNASMLNIDTNTAGSYFWIGTFSANTTAGQRTQSFTGNLDDLAVFNKALSSTEISNLYNTNIKKYNQVSNI